MRIPGLVMRPTYVLAAAVLGVGAAVAGTLPAAASGGVEVNPTQSIQAAIDNAAPGTTITLEPGTYHQFVVVWKDGITLSGEGGAGKVLLMPPSSGTSPCGSVGICVTPKTGSWVHNVTVTGITVKGFGDLGIFLWHSDRGRVDDTRLINNGGYGVFALQSSGSRITENVAVGNHEAGLYVGESPDADAVVSGNDSHGNAIGMLFRDSREGTISNNSLKDNCAGVIIVNTGLLPGVGNVTMVDNTINHNNLACPAAPPEVPALSGIGVAILGGDHVSVRDNTIDRNEAGGPTVASGGVILSFGFDKASTPSNHIAVVDNHIRHNATDIIVAVPLATNVFDDNSCKTSTPSGLC